MKLSGPGARVVSDMHSVRSVSIILSVALLSACQASAVPSGPQAIDLPLAGIRFTYPVPPIIREQEGEYLLKAGGANGFVNVIPYHQASKGVGDWTITPAIRDALLQTPSCDILKDRRVYLPVDTRKTMRCSVIRADADAIVISAVGYGVPDEAMDFLQGMIVVLRPKDVVLMTGLTPFDITHMEVQRMTEAFPASHPKLPVPQWPNAGFHYLAIDVRAYLETQLQPPSADVLFNQAELEAMARSIVLTGASSSAPAR